MALLTLGNLFIPNAVGGVQGMYGVSAPSPYLISTVETPVKACNVEPIQTVLVQNIQELIAKASNLRYGFVTYQLITNYFD
jgi:hypothetical protein